VLWFRISELIHLPLYSSQVELYRLFRIGDTNMDKMDDLVDYNELDPTTGMIFNAPSKGNEDLPDSDDCAFDDVQKEQHQTKYGDSIFYEPYVTKPPAGRLRTFYSSSG
jgi:hypothetical protein